MSDTPIENKVMSSPRRVDIAVTGRCNLACQYCFYADEMNTRNDLPIEIWQAFFEELGRLGVWNVCLTGGEVFTRPDLFELIDGVIANRMRYSLLSNGTLISEKTIELFSVGKRRQRLDSIQISIDGSSAEVHNNSRPKSFSRAMRGLKLLFEADFPVTVRVTINRFNVDDLENIANLLLEQIGIPAIGTNEAYPCGATTRSGGITLTPLERQRAMEILTRLVARYNGRINATAGPLALARECDLIEKSILMGETCIPGRGTLSSCGGVFTQMAIMHDGTMVPCHNLSTLHMGKVGEDSLQDIWQHHTLINAVRKRSRIPLSSLETCHSCQYIGFCRGGCPGGAVFLTGNLDNRNPLDCYRVHKGEDPYYIL